MLMGYNINKKMGRI